jgi:hypothetical protein
MERAVEQEQTNEFLSQKHIRRVLEKPIVAQHVRNFPPFMEPEISLSCPEECVIPWTLS